MLQNLAIEYQLGVLQNCTAINNVGTSLCDVGLDFSELSLRAKGTSLQLCVFCDTPIRVLQHHPFGIFSLFSSRFGRTSEEVYFSK